MPQKKTTKTTTSNLPATAEEAAVEVVKKQKRSSIEHKPQVKPGEMKAFLGNALTVSRWPKVDTKDPQQILDRIEEYYNFCYENDMKPDMAGLSLAIGVDRRALWKWEHGYECNKPIEVREALRQAREINESLLTQFMMNGKINPIPAIFLLKNNHGYTDQQEVVIAPKNPLGEAESAERIEQKYAESVIDTTGTIVGGE